MRNTASKNSKSALPAPSILTPADSDTSDVHVSDLDSDLEADELIPTYLKIKGKLYEIDPQLVEPISRKQNKNTKSKKLISTPNHSPAVRKLFSQLQQLASDALFDEYEAEAQWPAKRNQIAQRQAAKRLKETPTIASDDQIKLPSIGTAVASKEDPSITTNNDNIIGSEDETDFLGDMFAAIPDEPATKRASPEDSNAKDIILRDFGKASGLTARKVLEEAIRSRLARPFPIMSTFTNSSLGIQTHV